MGIGATRHQTSHLVELGRYRSGTLDRLRQQHAVLARGLAQRREELISDTVTLAVELAEVQTRYIAELEKELIFLRDENLRLMHQLMEEKPDGR